MELDYDLENEDIDIEEGLSLEEYILTDKAFGVILALLHQKLQLKWSEQFSDLVSETFYRLYNEFLIDINAEDYKTVQDFFDCNDLELNQEDLYETLQEIVEERIHETIWEIIKTNQRELSIFINYGTPSYQYGRRIRVAPYNARKITERLNRCMDWLSMRQVISTQLLFQQILPTEMNFAIKKGKVPFSFRNIYHHYDSDSWDAHRIYKNHPEVIFQTKGTLQVPKADRLFWIRLFTFWLNISNRDNSDYYNLAHEFITEKMGDLRNGITLTKDGQYLWELTPYNLNFFLHFLEEYISNDPSDYHKADSYIKTIRVNHNVSIQVEEFYHDLFGASLFNIYDLFPNVEIMGIK